MDNITLVIPAKEEAESLPLVLDEIKGLNLKVIIVLADDDLKTIDALKNYDCEILYQSQRGYGNAIIEGIKKAQTKYIAIFYWWTSEKYHKYENSYAWQYAKSKKARNIKPLLQ